VHVMQNYSEKFFRFFLTYSGSADHADHEYHLPDKKRHFLHGEKSTTLKGSDRPKDDDPSLTPVIFQVGIENQNFKLLFSDSASKTALENGVLISPSL
jgi:hypothetical protein